VDEMTALSILTHTLQNCLNDYTPAAEVFAALNYLASRIPAKWPFVEFREALCNHDEKRRRDSINSALTAVKLLLVVQGRPTATELREDDVSANSTGRNHCRR
jgi:hypothetical protein